MFSLKSEKVFVTWCVDVVFECVAVHGVRNLKVWCMAEIRSVETQLTINTQATSTALPQAPSLYGQ